ncbi:hypothetical protein HMPREF9622_01313 [Cutibacterium modestum HL037PA3]|uniref:Uncharacterized protein n=1 Tax=Cutibacterium modestum HL044PA1 TaxID=765109 RepID=A0ABP2KB75_9ACTN|nr:hypothetical protein HMPREF9621_00925 [Cutibacterium modestum HL037PA2]EFS93305.1 hypothetical protein HMPREF9607_00518 [Cutibacterium modestum HL044PA1]EFT15539.1 hypothetical protein HMPREF9622_01313 [Cutibacterium modestum HL037PA3]
MAGASRPVPTGSGTFRKTTFGSEQLFIVTFLDEVLIEERS